MKHILTLAACILVAFQVSAQLATELPRKATEQELETSRLLGLEEIMRAEAKGLRGGGDSTIIFFQDENKKSMQSKFRDFGPRAL